MQKYLYAISDIHGMADLFKRLLTEYDPKIHQLPKSVYCLERN